jgi:shikimate dehydrogenase
MPLKLDALDLAEEATDRAVAAGAANLLLMRDGKLFAANTDVGAIATLPSCERGEGAARAASPCSAMAARRAARWSR